MSRKRATHKRRSGGRRRGRRTGQAVHRVTRIFFADIAKVAGDSGIYRTIQPLNFPIADMIGSFTEYRIKSVKLTYQLYNQLNNNSVFPTLYFAPQRWNESATPASVSEVIQFAGVETFQFGPSRPTFSRTVTPYVNMVTTGPGRSPVASPWLSTTSDLPQHILNVEWLVNYNSTSAPTHTVRLNFIAEFEFRGPR